jgi:hypothetical protein
MPDTGVLDLATSRRSLANPIAGGAPMVVGLLAVAGLIAALAPAAPALAGPVVCTTTLEAPVANAAPVEMTRCGRVQTVPELVTRRFYSYTAPFERGVSLTNQITDFFGIAMGGGFEIALACDLIIASETAVFALPEPKVGLAALAGGLHRLPRQIGQKQAMGMILTGRRVGAEEGKTLGFVNEVTTPTDLLARAQAWADMIVDCSPTSIRASKEAVYRGLDEPSLEAAYRGQSKYGEINAMFKSPNILKLSVNRLVFSSAVI